MEATQQNKSSALFIAIHSLISAVLVGVVLSIADIYGLRPSKLTQLDATVLSELYLGIVTVHLSVTFAVTLVFLPGLARLPSRLVQFIGACLVLSIALGLNFELLQRRPNLMIVCSLAAIFGLLILKLSWSPRWSRPCYYAFLGLVGLMTAANATIKLGTNIPQHQSLIFLIWALGYFSCSRIVEQPLRQWFQKNAPLEYRSKLLLCLLAIVGGTAIMSIGNAIQNFDPRARFALRMRSVAAGTTLSVIDRISDFDRDGYAGWFGGGDCAIFDQSISPSSKEIAGDGLDNNCMAGDRSPSEIENLRSIMRGATDVEPHSTNNLVEAPIQQILLITIDALRHDASLPRSWGAIGHRCIEFQQAYSASHATTDTFYAMFHGRFASQGIFSKIGSFVMPMHDPVPTLPEILSQAKYTTMGIAFHHRFDPRMKLTRGFHSVWTAAARQEIIENIAAPTTLDQAKRWLAQTEKPWFLWVHFYDPHAPYLVQKDFSGLPPRNEVEAYAQEVERTDKAIVQLLNLLGEDIDNTAIILSSDHGEAFGEHGTRLHSTTLFNEEIHIPLWICPPYSGKAGINTTVSTPVSTIDIAPTILQWAGQKRSPNFIGRPLHSGLREVPIYAESTLEKPPIQAVIQGRYKLIRTLVDDNYALFDLVEDPLERKNLAYTDSPQLKQLKRSLDTIVAALSSPL